MNEIPLPISSPFKVFPSYLLQTWCTWCTSQPPPPTHSAPPTLCIFQPMSSHCLSMPLLQQGLDLLLFLDIFGRRRGLEFLVLPLFTLSRAGSNRVNEGESEERGSAAALPCILASHSDASTVALFRGPRRLFSPSSSACTHPDLYPVDCLLAVDFAQASSIGAQSVQTVLLWRAD